MLRIDWRYEMPRKYGFKGTWDNLIGPGPTTWQELATFWGGTALLTIAYVVIALIQGYSWNFWQFLLAALIMFDIGGGALALALNVAKRWHFSQEQQQHPDKAWFFCACHLHPFLIAWVFGEHAWGWAWMLYLTMIIGITILIKAPYYLQRPLAVFMVIFTILLLSCFSTPQGFTWFAIAYLLKLVMGHSVCEAPIRPN